MMSTVFGDIYDCIIDPSRWPATLERTARWVGLSAVGINVKNPARREVTFLRAWGGKFEIQAALPRHLFCPKSGHDGGLVCGAA